MILFFSQAVTDGGAASRHKRSSMFIVPAGLPGVDIVRNIGYATEVCRSQILTRFPLFFKMACTQKSGFEMCFDIGSQHLGCRGQNTSPYAQGCGLS